MYRLIISKDGKEIKRKRFNYWQDVMEAYPNLKFKKNRELGDYEATDGTYRYLLLELVFIGYGF